MIKYKYLLIFLAVIFYLGTGQALADMAPNPPPCAESMDYSQSPAVPLKPTCGYMDLSAQIDGNSYADRFVYLWVNQDGTVTSYSVAGSILETKLNRYSFNTYIAVDKDYFQKNNGLEGIFKTKEVLYLPYDAVEATSTDTMVPINANEFSQHSFNFIVSKDDKNLSVDNSNLINGKYSKYTGITFDAYAKTPNLLCHSGTCSKVIVYKPQAVIGNYIFLTQANIEYVPSNANQPAPYNDNNLNADQNPVQGDIQPQNQDQNTVLPPNIAQPSQPTEVLHWWTIVWNAIKSFFKNLFK